MPLTQWRVDGRPVAGARMMLAVALAVTVVESSAYLSRIADGRMRYPVLDWLPAPTTDAVLVYLALGLVAALLLLAGVLAGWAAGLGSALGAWALLWDQQTYSSHLVLCTLLLLYLAFARSGTRWSLSARLRPREDPTVPWWPQLLMLTQVSVVYLFTAVAKINPVFLSGEPLDGWTWLPGPPWVFQAMALATVAVELFLAVALWVPRLRVLAVLAGVALHAGIVGGLDHLNVVLFAFALTTTSTYGLFLTRPDVPLPRRAPERVPARLPA
ncbi:HTTM domain-containing protein [Isoptericola variabilis]|uniref:HTTM domain protein n=1 Tax=Isoptericola variabilis (strain 225) TaxID=743718 RepID=F6FQT8_ISOV2|nr:HTTM domain-containing protein [Isoptericola variabilis]AEG42903.1 HTTM domain protein [Isoptericola variabilis 225]TWH30211.1 vitamin K-dependent gamma-carboxylase-like protein [Isoptericola variabilis J7]